MVVTYPASSRATEFCFSSLLKKVLIPNSGSVSSNTPEVWKS
jgi:hypothetical protein